MYVKYGRSVGGKNTSVFAGVGTSSAPYIDPATDGTANLNFEGRWVKSTAATGTTRGMYHRLYLTGGAGGEAHRVFTTVESNTPADTVNGQHTSLSFGSSAGNVTGEGQASRNTLHVPNRTLTGTCAAIKAEIWADGASSDVSSGSTSFLRCTLGGDGTGVAAMDSTLRLFTLDGVTSGAGKLFYINAPTTLAAGIKVKVNGTTYVLPLYTTE